MTPSLRTRLTFIILLPLLLVSIGIGFWAYRNAEIRAKERFDTSLLSTALAISRDVASSGGDTPSRATRDMISDTSGGPVFYHAHAPDGVFVTGYATPPVPPTLPAPDQAQTYFDARYLGEPVRVLRLREPMQIDGLSGEFTFTVWQDTAVRDAFVRDLSGETFVIITILIGSVALIVWFGVGIGLRPLLDLQDAISRRTSDDLAPIQRRVPAEARGIVATLNTLLGQVSATIDAKNTFISNAAHQLRNPIAGILTMAEAVQSAPTPQAAQDRSGDLVDAAKHAGALANKLLSLERANAAADQIQFAPVDLVPLLNDTLAAFHSDRIAAHFTADQPQVMVSGDALMLGEAVTNLLDNARVHGGPQMTRIDVALATTPTTATITISDNGASIDPAQADIVLERFGQVAPTTGSGLGLPIAQAVATQHGGTLSLRPRPDGFSVALSLPVLSPG